MSSLSLVIITGLSGAGKSHAAKVLEDLGYYTLDNIPLQIIDKIVELFYGLNKDIAKIAFVIDSRAKDSTLVYRSIKMLKEKYKAVSIFMDASVETLVKRYKETRRVHPLGSELIDAISQEITLMSDIKEISDIVLNTDNKNIHELSREIRNIFNYGAGELIVTVQSFGFKYGVPSDADLMFDVRFLRNPHFDDGLRTMTGLNDEVKDYVKEDESYTVFFDKLYDMVNMLLPLYRSEGKRYLNISIGCTGGRHRSVTVAEDLIGMLKKDNINLIVKHRDINR